MKTKHLLTFLIAFLAINVASAKLKIPVCTPCETLKTIQELPADSELHELAEQKVKLSYLNNEYGVLFISFWNTDGKYVLSDVTNEHYFEIDAQAAEILKEKHNFDVEKAGSPLSFGQKFGGKIFLFVLIAFIVYGNIPSKKKAKQIKPTNI